MCIIVLESHIKQTHQERVEFLQKEGFLEIEPIGDYKPVVPEIVHVGGGITNFLMVKRLKEKKQRLKALENSNQLVNNHDA